MSSLRNVFIGICGFVLTACNEADDNHFSIEELSSPEILSSEKIEERWLATILSTMQGETGIYLKEAAQEHGVEIGYIENLNHAVGVFQPNSNNVTLEVPYGLSETTFDELVLTGRAIMYHELDHAIRHNTLEPLTCLSGEDEIDGIHTAHEAIADLTSFIGMSEDAEIGSAPPLSIQLGMPDDDRAVYYSVIPAPMADVIIAGLGENEYLHNNAELLDATFSAFYGTSRSEWYTLYYSQNIPDEVLAGYSVNAPLSDVLSDYQPGLDLSFDGLDRTTAFLKTHDSFLDGLQTDFSNSAFTSEAEGLTVRDLIYRKLELARPDSGPANHLTRTASNGGSEFFRDAPASRIGEAFDILVNDTDVIINFMASCQSADYLPENARSVAQNNYRVLSEYRPILTESVGQVREILSSGELSPQARINLRSIYRSLEDPLVTPSRNRNTLWNSDAVQSRHTGNKIACP